MNVYVALHDSEEGNQSFVVGAFSTEPKAQAACNEDAGLKPGTLRWRDFEAREPNGTKYAVVLVNLDVAV